MKRKLLLLISLFLIVTFSAYAQDDFYPGFVVKQSGDTIRGFLQSNNEIVNQSECFFKVSADSETVRYNTSDLLGYGFDTGNWYASKTVTISQFNNKFQFLNMIVVGRITVFKFIGADSKIRLFVEKIMAADFMN